MPLTIKQLGFFPVLRMGVRYLMGQRAYNISSYERLEAAFGFGILGARGLIKKDRVKETYSLDVVPDVSKRLFSLAKIRVNPETKTTHIPLAWHLENPAMADTAAELHLFIDNSGDAFRQLLGIVARVNSVLEYKHYVSLELMSDTDKRPCSAIIAAHGPLGVQILSKFAQQIEQELDPKRQGYSIDYIYPGKAYRTHATSHLFKAGEFRQRRQKIFVEMWHHLFTNEIMFMHDWDKLFPYMEKELTAKLNEHFLSS
jgi:hypothetical protein